MSDVDLADLRATRQWVSAGVWLCALITMCSSALSGMSTFAALKDHPYLGLVTGLSVDTALCVSLIGDRVLNQHGISIPHGRALRWCAAVMSITLNCGAALDARRWGLAIIHTFLVLVLVLVTEYGQAVSLQYTGLITAAEAKIAEQAAAVERARVAEIHRRESERLEAARREQAARDTAARLAREQALSALTAPRPPEAPKTPARATPAPRATKPLALVPASATRKAAPVRDAAMAWLAAQALAGRDLKTVTPAEIAQGISAKYDTCKKGLPRWVAQVRDLSEVAV